MTNKKLVDEILEYRDKIGPFGLYVGELSKADFVMGCYFDESTGEYKTYKNGERGFCTVRYSGKDEIEALNALLSMVKGRSKMLDNVRDR